MNVQFDRSRTRLSSVFAWNSRTLATPANDAYMFCRTAQAPGDAGDLSMLPFELIQLHTKEKISGVQGEFSQLLLFHRMLVSWRFPL